MYLFYSIHIQLDSLFASNREIKSFRTKVGLNVGYRESTLDWQRLRFEDDIDPSGGFTNPTSEPLTNDPSQALLLDFGFVSEYKNIVFGLCQS